METPLNLKYTKDHEWVSMEGNIATVGITDFAQRELGDIVYIEVETLGESLNADDVFGTVEAVKTVSDLFIPMSGKIIEFNESLDSTPEEVNSDPYGNGWMVKIEVKDHQELDNLLSAEDYKELIGED
ncbi:MAG: glycine cleavage system protein GcvH [Bacteroidota bacterium]|nr:glycine cleavage system protein GcvH [Bacteroidota bacterium]|tara:strand:+ start:6325 stop:6708 length:384 start_codon:yes stop_codon:yes gene_type:complete